MKHKMIKNVQNKFKVENIIGKREIVEDKIGEYSALLDIKYGDKYPNSFLDIYLHNGENLLNRPVIVYAHGGGYTWGDKRSGDPNGGANSFLWYFEEFLKSGYHIVSINYEFAPEYSYPTPIIQMSEAITFLKKHGEEYGILLNKVVFNGSSAGGQIVGQFVNIQTNPEYSKQIGMAAVLDAENIKAVLFNSALLDMEKFGKAHSWIFNYILTKCGQAYFNIKRLPKNPKVVEAKVTKYVTEKFPPSYISDGNSGTFYDQAFELNNKLEKLGVHHILNYYCKNKAKLGHGFENVNNYYGKDNIQKQLEFLKTCL